ncbi:NAC domain-containing protein 78-like [Cornus florida]|uniref:NAC domain-containing protein 78-like n=1 Tax=Cornus florida TaxID=4283 RepID=UPI00289B4BCB|nr:NAC domain-containing protein 78-like [Cornus florida]
MEASPVTKIPCGYKFQPTDEELIHYLLCKANEVSLPCQGVVNDVFDFYSKEPTELFQGSKEKILYFFTKLKKKHEKGSRINRVTRIGNWKGQDKPKDIKNGSTGNEEEGKEKVIGMKRNFTYNVKSDPKRSGWSMTEYNLSGTNLERAKVQTCNAVIEAVKPEVSVMQYNIIKATIEPEVIIEAENRNLIKEEIEPKVTVMQREDCNLITEEIEPEPILLQPEDCNDWLNDFAKQLIQNQEEIRESIETVLLPNIFYGDSGAFLI